jgi:hypothetical protein
VAGGPHLVTSASRDRRGCVNRAAPGYWAAFGARETSAVQCNCGNRCSQWSVAARLAAKTSTAGAR